MREHDHSSPAILTLITTLLLAACGGSSSGGSSTAAFSNPAVKAAMEPADLSTPEDVAQRVMLLDPANNFSRDYSDTASRLARELSPDSPDAGTTVAGCDEGTGTRRTEFSSTQSLDDNPYTRADDSEVRFNVAHLDLNNCLQTEPTSSGTLEGAVVLGIDTDEPADFSWPVETRPQTRMVGLGASPERPLLAVNEEGTFEARFHARIFDSLQYSPVEKGRFRALEQISKAGNVTNHFFAMSGIGEQDFYTVERTNLAQENYRITEGQFSMSVHRETDGVTTCPAPGTFNAEIVTPLYYDHFGLPAGGKLEISAGDTTATVHFSGDSFTVMMDGNSTLFEYFEPPFMDLDDPTVFCFS